MALIRRIKGRRVREEEFRTKGGKAIQEQLQLLAGDFGATIEDIQWDLRLISRKASLIATTLTEGSGGEIKIKLIGDRSGIHLVED